MRLLLVLFIPTLSFAQTDRINYIRQRFQEINSNIESFEKVETSDINVYKDLNSENYSYESTQIYRLAIVNMIRYYHNNTLVKAEITFNGDRQNMISDYYFDKDGLFFVFQKRTDFDEPKWSDSFDENHKKEMENRYYFDSNKLIRWINEFGITIERRTKKFEELEKQVLSDSELYRKYEAK